MRSKLKKPLIALFCISLVFLLGYIAMFIVLGTTVKVSGKAKPDFVYFLTEHFLRIGNNYIFKTDYIGGKLLYPWSPIALLVVSILTLVAIIVGIVVSCKKKHGAFSLYAIVLLLVLVPAADLITNHSWYIDAIMYTKRSFHFYDVGSKATTALCVYGICIVACAVLAFIFTYVTYAVGLAYACKKAVDVAEDEELEEAPVYDELEDKSYVMPDSVKEASYREASEPDEQTIIPDPLPEYSPSVEPQPEPKVEPEPEPLPDGKQESAPVSPTLEEKNNNVAIDPTALADMIRDIVRDIVRDEIARSDLNKPESRPTTDNHSIVGATFASPLVVQYFNSPIAAPMGMCAPGSIPGPAPTPAVEEKKAEPLPTPTPVVEEKKVETAPQVTPEVKAVEPAPVVQPVEEVKPKTPIIRIPFTDRIINAEKEMKDNYNELKNEILSWGVKSRVSNSGDTFRLHRKTYIKLTIAGKSLKLYFALDPNDYRESTIPVQDAGEKAIYEEIPLVFKVKSPLSMRRAKQLIQDVMEKDGLEQGEIGTVNWVKEIKASLADSK